MLGSDHVLRRVGRALGRIGCGIVGGRCRRGLFLRRAGDKIAVVLGGSIGVVGVIVVSVVAGLVVAAPARLLAIAEIGRGVLIVIGAVVEGPGGGIEQGEAFVQP